MSRGFRRYARAAAALLAAAAGRAAVDEAVRADWLLQAEIREPAFEADTPADAKAADAAGGVDGVINGAWGFHTALEPEPWWQVDLGRTARVDRVVLYNRCGDMAPRNARIRVLLSLDAKTFAPAYTNPGVVFHGFTDGRPLDAPLGAAPARWVRLQLPGREYLHLDEVQVFAGGTNLALRRPATQSSVSEWSVRHAGGASWRGTLARTVARGKKLAARLGEMGVDPAAALRALEAAAASAGPGADDDAVREAYLKAREAVRELALANPLLDFDRILFLKRAPPIFPHLSDERYGWWARPGGGVFVLEGFKSGAPRTRCLTADFPTGSFATAELCFDARTVVFAYSRYHPEVADLKDKASKAAVPEDTFYHLFEMNLDGSARRQLTRGRYDDFDPRYLPDGDLVFLSTRKGRFLQVSRDHARATAAADLPDSYVRCGGDEYRPVPVFTLHRMDAARRDLWPISAFETFEYTPWVADDGRLLYCRWDYIDRFNGHFFSLWSSRPDGTQPQLVYGNYTVRPQATMEPRSVPGSRRILFTAAAHHSNAGGSLVLFDRARGLEDLAPLTRLTPEVPFPETERNAGTYYLNPWPLSEEFFLVAWSRAKLPPHCRVDGGPDNPPNSQGLYLLDCFGNLELLYRDPEISSANPVPVRARPRPAAPPPAVDWAAAPVGRFVLQDVYQGLAGVTRGAVKSLRVVAVPPKVQPRMNQPALGVSREEPAKYVVGTAPVEADGSAHFLVPSGVPVFFQALDAEGRALQTMRSLTYVPPGQALACAGCHESRDRAPAGAGRPLALRRGPSQPAPGPDGSWPLSFDRLVQPVLDRACASCHGPGAAGAAAAKPDLASGRAFDALLAAQGGDLARVAHERDASAPLQTVSLQSRLVAHLKKDAARCGARLEAADWARLYTWLDTYALRQGYYSPEQAEELAAFRRAWEALPEGL